MQPRLTESECARCSEQQDGFPFHLKAHPLRRWGTTSASHPRMQSVSGEGDSSRRTPYKVSLLVLHPPSQHHSPVKSRHVPSPSHWPPRQQQLLPHETPVQVQIQMELPRAVYHPGEGSHPSPCFHSSGKYHAGHLNSSVHFQRRQELVS